MDKKEKINKAFDIALKEFENDLNQSENLNENHKKILSDLKNKKQKLVENFFLTSLETNKEGTLPVEMWESFQKMLQSAMLNSYFINECKKIKAKSIIKKYYNKESGNKDSIENIKNYLQIEMKNHYRNLNLEDTFEFSHSIFQLPFTVVEKIVSLCESLNTNFKDSISITKEEKNDFLKKVINEKRKIILTINNITLGYGDTLPITSVKALFDVDAFKSNSKINLAVLEYISRLINNNDAKENLKEKYGESIIEYLKLKISTYPNYISFLKKIKNKKEKPFFNVDGTQKEENSLKSLIEQEKNKNKGIEQNTDNHKEKEAEKKEL